MGIMIQALFRHGLLGFVAFVGLSGCDKPAEEPAGQTELEAETSTSADSKWLLDWCTREAATPEEIKGVIKWGADPLATDEEGRTTLMLVAANNPDPNVLKLMLELGVDVNAVDGKGWTALMHATANPNPEITAVLMDAGADSSMVDSEGRRASDLSNSDKGASQAPALKE